MFVGLSLLQVTMEFGLDKRAQTLQGLAFPLQEEAKRALQQLKKKRINYIQLVSHGSKYLKLIKQCALCIHCKHHLRLVFVSDIDCACLCTLCCRGWM